MASQKNNNIKLALLGHGLLALPIFELLRKKFIIVEANKADCLIVANFGKILAKEEINRPKFGAINIHPSLLPKYRGATPVQSAIAKGDKESGFTIIKMDEKIDHGKIFYQAKIKIEDDETTEQYISKVAQKCAVILPIVLKEYFAGNIKLIDQIDKNVTYTKKISGRIVLENIDNHQKVYNLIRAYGEEPGVFINLNNNQKLKLIEAKLINNKIMPTLVQKEGKKPMSYQTFLNGYHFRLPF